MEASEQRRHRGFQRQKVMAKAGLFPFLSFVLPSYAWIFLVQERSSRTAGVQQVSVKIVPFINVSLILL